MDFLGVITAIMLSAFLSKGAQDPKAIWAIPAFLGLFWLAGIGLLLGGLNMGLRRAAIAFTSGTLMVIQTGLFGSKQRQWMYDAVAAVRAGPSGMTVNDQPVLELQIFGKEPSKFGMLAGRGDPELLWLASELREALGVPEVLS